MAAASNFLELEILDHILRYGNGSLTAGSGAGYQPPATVYVALFSNSSSTAATDALESGTNATGSGVANWGHFEVNNGSYARQSVTFAAASSGSCASNATVTFPVATANYDTAGTTGATVTHIGIMDASTSGNCLFAGTLTTSKTVSSGDQFTVSSGNLTVSLA
jgi:hypothetical protein